VAVEVKKICRTCGGSQIVTEGVLQNRKCFQGMTPREIALMKKNKIKGGTVKDTHSCGNWSKGVNKC